MPQVLEVLPPPTVWPPVHRLIVLAVVHYDHLELGLAIEEGFVKSEVFSCDVRAPWIFDVLAEERFVLGGHDCASDSEGGGGGELLVGLVDGHFDVSLDVSSSDVEVGQEF